VIRSRIRKNSGGRPTVTYQFVTAWDAPFPLIRSVSKQFPTLDFVLGAVAPADGSACS
jgi:hypothetical protein